MLTTTPRSTTPECDGDPRAGRSVAELERAYRAERRRALVGHWTYDLPYHLDLLRQLKEARGR
jgi:hypothetical protein